MIHFNDHEIPSFLHYDNINEIIISGTIFIFMHSEYLK